jgi:hypothetical protein
MVAAPPDWTRTDAEFVPLARSAISSRRPKTRSKLRLRRTKRRDFASMAWVVLLSIEKTIRVFHS